MVDDLAGYVWYHKNGIANILSLVKVRIEHDVKFDSENGNKFEERWLWEKMMFNQSSNGIYYFYINKSDKGITMVTTVDKRMEKYTKKTITQDEVTGQETMLNIMKNKA